MAIIREMTTRNGVRVRIHDDFMVPRDSEEGRRRIEAQQRIAREIMTAWALRHASDGSAGSTPAGRDGHTGHLLGL